MSLDNKQLEDFRNDIADHNEAFSSDELQRLYEREGTYEGAIVLAIDQLLMNATKMTRYQQNMTSENLDQLVPNLLHARKIWKERLASATSKQKTRMVGISGGKPRQEIPGES